MMKLVSNAGQDFPATRTVVLEDFVHISAVRLIGTPTLSDIRPITPALLADRLSKHGEQENTVLTPAISKIGSVMPDDSGTVEKRI